MTDHVLRVVVSSSPAAMPRGSSIVSLGFAKAGSPQAGRRAGRWLGGAGRGCEKRVRTDPGPVSVGAVGSRTEEGRGRKRVRRCRSSHLDRQEASEWEGAYQFPADRSHQREPVRSWLTHRLRGSKCPNEVSGISSSVGPFGSPLRLTVLGWRLRQPTSATAKGVRADATRYPSA